MFDDYIFSLNVDPDDMSDDDPPISPTTTSFSAFRHNGRYSLTTAPALPDLMSNTGYTLGDERIDHLAHELREQVFISDRQTHRRTQRERPLEQGHHHTNERQDAVPLSASSVQPSVNGNGPRMSFRQRVEAQLGIAGAGAGVGAGTELTLEAIQSKRPRRQTDPRPPHNPCLESLLTTMVEHNVQCNVQGSAPESPTLRARPSFSRPFSRSGLADLAGLMDLEVDANYCEGEDEALLNDTVALREASAPVGVRKAGVLRYRTSADAGIQCRNMKRNVPRMRRRVAKTKASAPSAVPTSATTA